MNTSDSLVSHALRSMACAAFVTISAASVVACGGDSSGAGGSGGGGTGGAPGSGSATGGAPGTGGDSTGGAPGTGGSTSTSPDASTATGTGGASGTGGATTTASGTGGSGTGGGGYAFCSDCTAETGAQTNECKAERDACLADDNCKAVYNCAYVNPGCDTSGEGACCTVKCYASANESVAAVNLFRAFDDCMICQTCKTICGDIAADYCNTLENPGPACL